MFLGNQMRMKKILGELIHPLLFSLAPILSLVAHNAGDMRLAQVGWVLAVSAGMAVVLQVILAWVFRGAVRGALVTSGLLVVFFLYGHAFDLVRRTGWIQATAGIHGLVGGVGACLLGLCVLSVCRTKRDLAPLSRGLTFVSVLLVVMAVVGLMRGPLPGGAPTKVQVTPDPSAAREWSVAARPAPPILVDDPAKPDVYYIILDGYARADVLKAVHGFDNRWFLDQLKARGFLVVEKSLANYAYTHFSLATSLNMDYAENVLQSSPGRKESARAPSYRAIRNPRVGRIFQSHGYRFIHLATNWGGTEDSDAADIVLRERPRWLQQEFMEVLLRTTALRLFEPNVADIHLYGFRKLQDLPSLAGPTFVFAHFLIPHKPYVFDRNGHVRKDVPLALQWKDNDGGWENRQAYIEQLQYVNGMILKTVDGILAQSGGRRPWIVLQSDHGTAALQAYGSGVPGEPATDAFIRERFGNLTALLVPDEVRAGIPETVTPVNVFRILLNALFAEDLDILPDRHYLGSRMSRFREVGAILRQGGLDAESVRTILDSGEAGRVVPEEH